MPDTKTSVRWEQFDKPYLEKAFKAAGVSARVVNAQGDPQKQKSQADQCIADGAKVLIIAPIDSGSAAAIEKAATAKGVKSIDYDRQVEGGIGRPVRLVRRPPGRRAPGQGRRRRPEGATASTRRIRSSPRSDGGQEDANSFLFKGGYDPVLNPLYTSGASEEGPGAVRARLGQPEGRDDLRADAGQDRQQDRRGRRGERRHRERGRRRR